VLKRALQKELCLWIGLEIIEKARQKPGSGLSSTAEEKMQSHEAKSRSSTQKWLIGCGIGCGVIIVILIALGISGFFFIRNIVHEFHDMETLEDTLTEKYGRMKEFSPEPDGSIPAQRMEAFLSVRDDFALVREEMESSLITLSEEKGTEEIELARPKSRPRNVFHMIRLGIGIIPQIAEFFKSRNQALLDNGMGLGEYYYIYVVAYYSWLGKSPEDGPPFRLVGRDEERDFWDEDEEEILEMRRDRILRRIHRLILPMLRNQLEDLRTQQLPRVSEVWLERLKDEIDAMEADRFRLPWQDGLPQTLESSLSPYRGRLEASYSKMANALEVAFEQR
jgi:hypothetical protein